MDRDWEFYNEILFGSLWAAYDEGMADADLDNEEVQLQTKYTKYEVQFADRKATVVFDKAVALDDVLNITGAICATGIE